MGSAQASLVIERTADEVWARIGDFGDPSWFPGLASWVLDGDVRTTTIAGRNLQHVERLVHRDDTGRTYSYGTIGYRGDTVVELEGGKTVDLYAMVGHHEATVTVVPVDERSARVTYEVTVDDDDQAKSMGARYQAVLERLKAEMER